MQVRVVDHPPTCHIASLDWITRRIGSSPHFGAHCLGLAIFRRSVVSRLFSDVEQDQSFGSSMSRGNRESVSADGV